MKAEKEDLDMDNKPLNRTELILLRLYDNKEKVFVFCITIISLIAQLYLSLSSWGIIHADELFQSLEVAHYIVYDYAFLPPEFDMTHIFFPNYAMSRSHLFPCIFAFFLYLGKVFGWNYWSVCIPLIQVVLAINAAILPYATYRLVKQFTKSSKKAGFSSIIMTISPIIASLASRSLTNTFFVPWIFLIIASYWKIIDRLKKFPNEQDLDKDQQLKQIISPTIISYARIFILTFLLGLILYIRIDLLIGVLALLLPTFPYKKVWVYIVHFFGLILAASVGGLIDFIFYGKFLVSPIHWFTFNIIEEHSLMFGSEPFFYYFRYLLINPISSALSLFSFVIPLILLVYYLITNLQKRSIEFAYIRNLIGFQFATIFVILLFSIPKHKEIRFIYFALVYLHIGFSLVLETILSYVLHHINHFKKIKKLGAFFRVHKKYVFITLLLFLVVSVLFLPLLTIFLVETQFNIAFLNETAQSLAFVGQQSDAKGLILLDNWWKGASYFYLHKDIPIEYIGNPESELGFDMLIFYLSWNRTELNYILLPTFQISKVPNLLDYFDYYNYNLVFEKNSEVRVYRYSPNP